MLRHVSTASGKKKLNFEAKSSAPPTFLFLQPRMERNIATVKRNKGILGFREIFNSRRIRGFVSQHWKVRRVEGNFGVKLHVDHLKREWISLLFSRILLLHSRIRSNEYSKYQNSLKSKFHLIGSTRTIPPVFQLLSNRIRDLEEIWLSNKEEIARKWLAIVPFESPSRPLRNPFRWRRDFLPATNHLT